jgi:hypothetical protein
MQTPRQIEDCSAHRQAERVSRRAKPLKGAIQRHLSTFVLTDFQISCFNQIRRIRSLATARKGIKALMDLESAKEFLSANRRELALAFLARADEAGTAFRALIFGANLAAIGFVFAHSGATRFHLASLLSFGFSALLILYSWDMQKSKALTRFQSLQTGDLETYLAQDRRPNYSIDRLAAFFLAVGIAIEFAVFGGLRITIG